jgi:hypothetical protein
MGFGGNDFFGMDDLSLGQAMYMAEAEGVTDMTSTRLTKINAICNDLDGIRNRDPYADLDDYIDQVIERYGVDIDTLTDEERRMIDGHLY